jgi:hypothetical protein
VSDYIIRVACTRSGRDSDSGISLFVLDKTFPGIAIADMKVLMENAKSVIRYAA